MRHRLGRSIAICAHSIILPPGAKRGGHNAMAMCTVNKNVHNVLCSKQAGSLYDSVNALHTECMICCDD